MPTLLDELALGIVLVERIDAREPEKEKHSSSGQMELDEQPIVLLYRESEHCRKFGVEPNTAIVDRRQCL